MMRSLFILILVVSASIIASCGQAERTASNVATARGTDRGFGFNYSKDDLFEDAVQNIDQKIRDGDILALENIEPSLEDDNVYTRIDAGLVGNDETFVVRLPNEAQCVPGSGQWQMLEENEEVTIVLDDDTCIARVTIKETATVDEEALFGILQYTGEVITNSQLRKRIDYRIQLGDRARNSKIVLSAVQRESRGLSEADLVTEANPEGWDMAAGMIEILSSFEIDGSGVRFPVNAIVMPDSFSERLTATGDLAAPPEGFSYVEGEEPEIFCSIQQKAGFFSEVAIADHLLPKLPGDDLGWGEGDPLCPFEHVGTDFAVGEHGQLEFRMKTKDLFESQAGGRQTIFGLDRYDFSTGPNNFLYIEYKMPLSNDSTGERLSYLHRFYFIANVIASPEPPGLPPYRRLGTYNESEYLLVQQVMTQTKMESIIPAFEALFEDAEVYLVDIDSGFEQNFLVGQLGQQRAWIGLNDRANESEFIRQKDGRVLDLEVDFWGFAPGKAAEDRSRNCVHMNFSPNGAWADTQCYKKYLSVIEVRKGDTEVLR